MKFDGLPHIAEKLQKLEESRRGNWKVARAVPLELEK